MYFLFLAFYTNMRLFLFTFFFFVVVVVAMLCRRCLCVYVSFNLYDGIKTFPCLCWWCIMYMMRACEHAFFGYIVFFLAFFIHIWFLGVVVTVYMFFFRFTICLFDEYFPVWHAIHATIHFIINNCTIGNGSRAYMQPARLLAVSALRLHSE